MEASRVVYGAKALLAALLVVALLLFAGAGTALAHNLVVSLPERVRAFARWSAAGRHTRRLRLPTKKPLRW